MCIRDSLIGLSGGINVLTALYLGAGKKQALSHTVHSSLIVSIASGLLLLLFGVCFAHPVLELLKTKEELIDGSVPVSYTHLVWMEPAHKAKAMLKKGWIIL